MVKYKLPGRPFRARLHVGLVVALIFSNALILAFPHTAFAQSTGSHNDWEAKGKHLQVSLDAQYKDLNSKLALKKTNDVTSLVLQDASPSMSIEDLTQVFRSAGFREPGTAPNGQMVFRCRSAALYRLSRS